MMKNTDVLIPKKKVMQMTSLSSTTIWRLERKGTFPKRVKISANRVAYQYQDVLDFCENGIWGEV